jgi:hypothetical protein
MESKKTGNSIFSFEREAGIDSILGNWAGKHSPSSQLSRMPRAKSEEFE